MHQEIKPVERVEAVLTLPGSKSFTHRALIAAALAGGESLLTQALKSEDTELTAQALAQMGVGVEWQDAAVRVKGNGGRLAAPAEPIFLGNSGTSMRLLTAVAALAAGTVTLTGTPRLCERPMGELLAALRQLGADAVPVAGNDCPPVKVGGGIPGGRTSLSGATSSQYLSALLLVGPLTPQGIAVEITGDLVSRPYVDLTLEVMADFGVSYYREGYRFFEAPGGQCYQAQEYAIEADASSASYFWAAAALTGGRVTVTNLTIESSQGDIDFLSVLARMGCQISSTEEGLTVVGGPLTGIEVDMSAMPDMVPTLAVVAAFAQGKTRITGVAHLKHKESDRLGATVGELAKLGIAAQETKDGLLILGGAPQGGVIDPHDDHRLAMSFAVAGLKAPGIVIQNSGCVAKSFPDFWDYFRRLA